MDENRQAASDNNFAITAPSRSLELQSYSNPFAAPETRNSGGGKWEELTIPEQATPALKEKTEMKEIEELARKFYDRHIAACRALNVPESRIRGYRGKVLEECRELARRGLLDDLDAPIPDGRVSCLFPQYQEPKDKSTVSPATIRKEKA